MNSVPRFLCPALSRAVRTQARSNARPPKSLLVQNIDKLEAYIKSLKKINKRQSLGTKDVQQDDLTEREITDMYKALAKPQELALEAPKEILPVRLCSKLGMTPSDLSGPVDWDKRISAFIGAGATRDLSTKELNLILTAMPHSARVQSGRRLVDHASCRPDRFTYDFLMDSYAAQGQATEALAIFDLSREAGNEPSMYSYAHLMKAFAVTKDLAKATAMYQYMRDHNVEPNLVVYTSLITTCVRTNNVARAFSVFDTLKYMSKETAPDAQTYSLMIFACSLDPQLSAERASDLFQEMNEKGLKPTRETFNSLIHVYAARKEYFAEAWKMSELMQRNQISLDKITWHSLLSACVTNRDLQKARKLVMELHRLGEADPAWKPDVITYQLLFRAYAGASVRRSREPTDVMQSNTSLEVDDVQFEDIWINETPFSSNAALLESSRVFKYVSTHRPHFLSTQLIDTYMTVAIAFDGSASTFQSHWDTLYRVHGKGRYSYEIGLRAAYVFKDWELLQQVWTERESWRHTRPDAKGTADSAANIRREDFQATVMYIEALSRVNRVHQASKVIMDARSKYSFEKKHLKCFRAKSFEVRDEDAVLLYQDMFDSSESQQRKSRWY